MSADQLGITWRAACSYQPVHVLNSLLEVCRPMYLCGCVLLSLGCGPVTRVSSSTSWDAAIRWLSRSSLLIGHSLAWLASSCAIKMDVSNSLLPLFFLLHNQSAKSNTEPKYGSLESPPPTGYFHSNSRRFDATRLWNESNFRLEKKFQVCPVDRGKAACWFWPQQISSTVASIECQSSEKWRPSHSDFHRTGNRTSAVNGVCGGGGKVQTCS